MSIIKANPVETTLEYLLAHPDADVRAGARLIEESLERKKRVLGLVQEALSQLRLDLKYICFDLDCTRKERDNALTKLSNGPFGEQK